MFCFIANLNSYWTRNSNSSISGLFKSKKKINANLGKHEHAILLNLMSMENIMYNIEMTLSIRIHNS